MNFYIIAALSLTIAVPAVIALVVFKKIDYRPYLPFMILLWVGFINEVISFIVSHVYDTNMINFNLYFLVMGILLLWQFRRWKVIDNPRIYWGLQAALALFWAWEGFVLHTLFRANSYYIIGAYSVVAVLCIILLNRLTVGSRTRLYRHPVFLICVGLVTISGIAVCVEIFWLYGSKEQQNLMSPVLRIIPIVNVITYIVYSIALLWIPRLYRYSIPS